MKTDRFVKIVLVIIVGLLFLNCFKDNGSSKIPGIFGTKVQATAPAFLQKGKSYCFNKQGSGAGGYNALPYKILEIDSNSGWLNVQEYQSSLLKPCSSENVGKATLGDSYWVNTATFDFISEINLAK